MNSVLRRGLGLRTQAVHDSLNRLGFVGPNEVVMIVTVKRGADAARVQQTAPSHGLWGATMLGEAGLPFAVEPHSRKVSPDLIRAIDGVQAVAVATSAH